VRHVAEPRLDAGRRLARVAGLGGCIDVSDGLEADAEHLLGPFGLAAELQRDALPVPPRFPGACSRLGVAPLELAAGGGEDYELLFTLRRSGPSAAALTRRLRVRVTEIGRVVRSVRPSRAPARGWRHF
jgi:thiamine-monophosphate kinase